MAVKEDFLKDHRQTLMQRIRNPIELADELCGKISDEMYANIKSQKTSHAMVREIYLCLNSKTLFNITYDWLKKNESELLEELEKSDPEAEAPQRKRSRDETDQTVDETENDCTASLAKRSKDETKQTVDETDNNCTGSPDQVDLKIISTFPKLEKWVSENSQQLICDLKTKLEEGGMETLKTILKGKEPKNNLCFNTKDIDDIRKNTELKVFLASKRKAKFPKLIYKMFFQKRRSVLARKEPQPLAEGSGEGKDQTGVPQPSAEGSGEGKDHTGVPKPSAEGSGEGKDHTGVPKPSAEGSGEGKDQTGVPQPSAEGSGEGKDQTGVPQPSAEGSGEGKDQTGVPQPSAEGSGEGKDQTGVPQPSAEGSGEGKDQTGVPQPSAEGSGEGKDQTGVPQPSAEGSGEGKDQTGVPQPSAEGSGDGKYQTGVPQPGLGTNKKGKSNKAGLQKKMDRNTLVTGWAKSQCNGHKKGVKNILDQISIMCSAEHRDYPCFTAENVMVYKNPETHESKILFTTNKSQSKSLDPMVHYLMFVCDIKKAVVLVPEEQNELEIEYEGFSDLKKCTRFILEAFAPALAVFKSIQKEELYSCLSDHDDD